MGTRLTVFNQKGGVGKTTTVLNLGAALAQRGQVPLLVEVDALFGKGPDILNKLKQGLDAGWNGTRPVLIDCCPMLGVLSLSGIFASERVLIPISTDYLALRGALALEKTLKALEYVLKR